jgi:two-component system CheB/CheR fusion protein
VFTSLRSAVVVIDREYRVQVWNGRAEDLWGVRPDEAQREHFLGLDLGLPVADLRQPIREVLNGTREQYDLVVPATSRRGKSIECRVNIAPLRRTDRAITGAILLMDEQQEGDVR